MTLETRSKLLVKDTSTSFKNENQHIFLIEKEQIERKILTLWKQPDSILPPFPMTWYHLFCRITDKKRMWKRENEHQLKHLCTYDLKKKLFVTFALQLLKLWFSYIFCWWLSHLTMLLLEWICAGQNHPLWKILTS